MRDMRTPERSCGRYEGGQQRGPSEEDEVGGHQGNKDGGQKRGLGEKLRSYDSREAWTREMKELRCLGKGKEEEEQQKNLGEKEEDREESTESLGNEEDDRGQQRVLDVRDEDNSVAVWNR